jgi:hypothetical protein
MRGAKRVASTWRATLLLACSTGCSALPVIDDVACGNGAIDEGEQCDPYAARYPSGTLCADASDSARACHFVCSRASGVPSCPAGLGCGVDGACHAASGSFDETETSPIELANFHDLVLADMDDDDLIDLVITGQREVTVLYGRQQGVFGNAIRSPVETVRSPSLAADLDGDAFLDLVVASPIGPVVLTGSRLRTLTPLIGSRLGFTGPRPFDMHLLDLRAANCLPEPASVRILLDGGAGSMVIEYLSRRNDPRPSNVISLGTPSGADVTVADLDDDLRDELIVAPYGGAELLVYAQVCSNGSATLEPYEKGPVIPLPPSYLLPRASFESSVPPRVVLSANLAGDEVEDLLIHVRHTETASDALAIATGLAGGGFDAARIDPRVGADLLPVLAAGDLDGDGLSEIITRDRIASYDAAIAAFRSVRGLLSASSAILADVDADGRIDIVGIGYRTPSDVDPRSEIEILLNESSDRSPLTFTPSAIPLEVRGQTVQAGDFDRDSVTDIAVLGRSTLTIVYGDRFRRFEQRDFDLPCAVGLWARYPSALALDLCGPNGPPEDVGILFGLPTRSLSSPVVLKEQGNYYLDLAELSGDSTPDLIVDDFELVSFSEGLGTGLFSPAITRTRVSGGLSSCERIVSGDLDGDGRDELLTICSEEGKAILRAVEIDREGAGSSVAIPSMRSGVPEFLRDLNGDGRLELGIAFEEDPGLHGVAVVWDIRAALAAGRIDDHGVSRAYQPDSVDGVVAINADADEDLEVAGVSKFLDAIGFRAQIFVADLPGPGAPSANAQRIDAPLRSGTTAIVLRAADLDRDGIDDLIFGDGGQLHIYRGRPGQ